MSNVTGLQIRILTRRVHRERKRGGGGKGKHSKKKKQTKRSMQKKGDLLEMQNMMIRHPNISDKSHWCSRNEKRRDKQKKMGKGKKR